MGGIDRDQIQESLRAMGLGIGDKVVFHSSLRSIGHVEGGPDAVIDAFLNVVGAAGGSEGPARPSGTVMVPTFSYSFVGNARAVAFDPVTAPSFTGLITEVFRKKRGAVRSLHPTHSVAAIGRDAEELVRGHETVAALGAGSPFHRLAEAGGYVALIGCGNTRNSLIHVIESIARVPYIDIFCWQHLGWREAARVIGADGREHEVPLFEVPGCSESFDRLTPHLVRAGVMIEGRIGEARAYLLKAREVIRIGVEILGRDPFYLLCPVGTCQACDHRRDGVNRRDNRR
ncbi:MAG: AAC(3) family N-acetyltransferase [Firmicutes bacterium]|nr:AAC(3) family N-acetyltransferase [Bacillota bacterium]